jgi:hypothetical protein
MAIRIEKKIVDYRVGGREDASAAPADVTQASDAAGKEPEDNVVQLHEKLERPEMLIGSTYKVKTPLSEHALYVTINDIILNHGTENELRRPFEIFINSKNMDHFQWIVALTRIVSAVFRKGGDVTFLVEELRSVFDPRGGYFKKGGKYMPSLVAEIGDAIECHMRMIGLLKDDGLDEHQKKLVAEKRAQFEAASGTVCTNDTEAVVTSDFPEGSQLCTKCHTKAAIKMDGCLTCLNCGESKCG